MASKRNSKGRGVNAKGRSKLGPGYIRLPRQIINETAAWSSLCPGASKLLLCVWARFNGFNNGQIVVSERDALKSTGAKSRNSVRKWFRELEDKGFLECTERGHFDYRGSPASTWRVTAERTPDGKPPTNDFDKLGKRK